MICPKCGKAIKVGASFCEYCGTKVEHVRLEEVTRPIEGHLEKSQSSKNPGTVVKHLCPLAIIGVIAVVITLLISLKPITNRANYIREEKNDHINYYVRNGYNHSGRCVECEEYDEERDDNNQRGAVLWQTAITNCILITFGGAVTYGVGVIAEKQHKG